MRAGWRLFIVTCVAALLAVVVAAWAWYPPLYGAYPAQNAQRSFIRRGIEGASADDAAQNRININTAIKEELQLLPGIGEKRALAIIAYREANGPFTSAEELLLVPGIGEKTLAGLEHLVTW